MDQQRRRHTRRLTVRLLFAQALDAATLAIFYMAIGPGEHAERNPLVLVLMAVGGISAVALAKVGISAWIGWRREHPPTRARWWSKPITSQRFIWIETVAISTATASGIVGAGFNSAAILNSLTGVAIHL